MNGLVIVSVLSWTKYGWDMMRLVLAKINQIRCFHSFSALFVLVIRQWTACKHHRLYSKPRDVKTIPTDQIRSRRARQRHVGIYKQKVQSKAQSIWPKWTPWQARWQLLESALRGILKMEMEVALGCLFSWFNPLQSPNLRASKNWTMLGINGSCFSSCRFSFFHPKYVSLLNIM